MQIEEEEFKTYKLDENKLIKYGFIKKDNGYSYSTYIIAKSFRVDITIYKDNIVGKIYDLEAECEYTSFRIKNITGEFALTIKKEYEKILKDIRNHCFEKNYFIYNQANRLTNYIINEYNIYPEFLWDKNPRFGVFRNQKTKKWFGIIMNIDKSKLISSNTKEVEILNVKLNNDTKKYLKINGIYSAYHMNKKTWISIILDDTLTDREIIKLINISYSYSEQKNSWIIPANPKYFDVITYIETMTVFSWKQPKKINIGDFVYIYLSAPYSAILYKCEVIELNLYNDQTHPTMNLKLIKKYNPQRYTFEKLKEYGLNSVRSPRRIPDKMSKQLNQENNI